MQFTGIRITNGSCSAPAFLYHNTTTFDLVPKGCCLVIKEGTPDIVLSFDRISALVVETGGLTSHPAILTREFGVPCLVGVIGIVNAVKENSKLWIEFGDSDHTVSLVRK